MSQSPLEKLLAEYAALDQNPPRWPSADEQKSLLYYWEELAAIAVEPDHTKSGSRVSVWIRTVRAIDDFSVGQRRMPRENNRLSPEDGTAAT